MMNTAQKGRSDLQAGVAAPRPRAGRAGPRGGVRDRRRRPHPRRPPRPARRAGPALHRRRGRVPHPLLTQPGTDFHKQHRADCTISRPDLCIAAPRSGREIVRALENACGSLSAGGVSRRRRRRRRPRGRGPSGRGSPRSGRRRCRPAPTTPSSGGCGAAGGTARRSRRRRSVGLGLAARLSRPYPAGDARGGRRVRRPQAGGARRARPPGPTTDRVREAVFNSLGSLGLSTAPLVADLFAGSGALGIEALVARRRRTACSSSATAARCRRSTPTSTRSGSTGAARVVAADVLAVCAAVRRRRHRLRRPAVRLRRLATACSTSSPPASWSPSRVARSAAPDGWEQTRGRSATAAPGSPSCERLTRRTREYGVAARRTVSRRTP